MSVEKEIFVEDVLELLDNGKTREEIQAHYNLTKKELVHLFQHPDLKGRKTKSVPKIIIRKRNELETSNSVESVNEVENVVETVVEETVETVVEQNTTQEVVVDSPIGEVAEATQSNSPFAAPTPGNAFTSTVPEPAEVPEPISRPTKTRANGSNVFGAFTQATQNEASQPNTAEETPATPARPKASWS